MNQPALFDAQQFKPSPICCYEKPCPYQGRAVYGPPRDMGGAVNRDVRCLKCQRTGEESVNTEAGA